MTTDIRISDVMTPWAFWIDGRQTATTAREMMQTYGIRHLPVMEGKRVLGMLYERDVSFALAWKHAEKPEFEVREICGPEPFIVSPDIQLSAVLDTMVKERCDCTLVMENEKLVGIFTSTDACRVLAQKLPSGSAPSKAA